MKQYLAFENICMEFPGVKALDQMTFSVGQGEIVAFLGENGAGKSTLLKILNGDYRHTSGTIYLDNKEVVFSSPNEAIAAGISVIYQERQLAPFLSVAENIFVGHLPMKGKLIDFKSLNQNAQKIIDEFGLPIKPEQQVKDISVAYQQMVEIMKSYSRNADVICFDEPTAPLTDSEIVILFKIINRLKDMGKAIIYVSHRMNEIFQLADRVIVFKDGRFVVDKKLRETTEEELIRLMVGRDLGDVFKELSRNEKIGAPVIELKKISNEHVKEVSFTVHEGEILGLAGLAGAGRTETARAIFGADPVTSGEMQLRGEKYLPKSPRDAMDHHIALCPEDRKLEGLALIQNVRENASISILNRLCKRGFVDAKKEETFITQAIKDFSIRTPSPEQKVMNLSGGNQQKVILARWMAIHPQLIIFDEPTKGIDVGAKAEIYHMICETAKLGVAVILISSELTEVIGLSDRIIVMKDGSVTGEVTREEATEPLILSYAMVGKASREEN